MVSAPDWNMYTESLKEALNLSKEATAQADKRALAAEKATSLAEEKAALVEANLIKELARSKAVVCERFALETCAFKYMKLHNVKGVFTATNGVRLIRDNLILPKGKLSKEAQAIFNKLTSLKEFSSVRLKDFEKHCAAVDPYRTASTNIHYPPGVTSGFCVGYSQDLMVRLFNAVYVILCHEQSLFDIEPIHILNDVGQDVCIVEVAGELKDAQTGKIL
jgi:hypothetical protein